MLFLYCHDESGVKLSVNLLQWGRQYSDTRNMENCCPHWHTFTLPVISYAHSQGIKQNSHSRSTSFQQRSNRKTLNHISMCSLNLTSPRIKVKTLPKNVASRVLAAKLIVDISGKIACWQVKAGGVFAATKKKFPKPGTTHTLYPHRHNGNVNNKQPWPLLLEYLLNVKYWRANSTFTLLKMRRERRANGWWHNQALLMRDCCLKHLRTSYQ